MDPNNPFSLAAGPPFAGHPGSNPPPPALGLPPRPLSNPPGGPDISALRAAALQSSRNKLAQAVARQPVMPAYEDGREAASPVLSLAERLNPRPMPSLAARIGGRKVGSAGGDWEEGEISEGEEARRREGSGAAGGKARAGGEAGTKRASNSQIQAAFDEVRGKTHSAQAQRPAVVEAPVAAPQPDPFPRPRSPGYQVQHDAGAPLYHNDPFPLPPSDSFAPPLQEQNIPPLSQPYQPHPLPAPVVHRPTQEELYRPPRPRPLPTQEELYRPPRDKRPTQEELYRPPQPRTRPSDQWRPEADDSNIPMNRSALADPYRQPPPPPPSQRDYYRGPVDPFPRQRSPGPALGYSDPFPRQRSPPIRHDPFPRQWSPLPPPPPLHQDPFSRQRSPPPRPPVSRYEMAPRERSPPPHLGERSQYSYDPYDPYAPDPYGEVSYRSYDAPRPRSPLPMRARTPPRARSPPRARTPPRPRSPPPPPVRYEERQPEPRPTSLPLTPVQNEAMQVDARPRSPSLPPSVSLPHHPNTPPAPPPPLRVEPPTPMVADVRRKDEGGADAMDMMSSDAPIAAAAADFTPTEARDYMDIIRNLIYEGFTPEVLVSRGATAKYVMAVCEEIVDSTKKRKSLWLDAREPEPERVDSPDHHEPSRAKMIRMRSPTPEVEVKVEERGKEDAGSDDEQVVQRMEMPERVSGAPPTPDLPSPAIQPTSQAVKVESYRPSKSPNLAVQATAEGAASPRLQELLPPSLSVPDLPPAPTSTSPTVPAAAPVPEPVAAPPAARKRATKKEREASKLLREDAEHAAPVTPPLPAGPLPFVQSAGFAAVPISPGHSLPPRPDTTTSPVPHTRKEKKAAATARRKAKKLQQQQEGASEPAGGMPPQPPSTAPPAIPPPPPDFATQNALLETRRKALESMRARRSAVAAAPPPPAPTVANTVQWRAPEEPVGPWGSATAAGTGSGTPAGLTAEDAALQKSIDEQMAELEKEMLGLQKTTAEAKAREEQQQASAAGANDDEVDMDVDMEMDTLEEGEITPASAPPSAPPSAQPAAATLLPPKPSTSTSTTPTLAAGVLPRRVGPRRVAAEDLMESRPSSAPPRPLPPAKWKPFGGVMRMNRLILNLDEPDSSDDESDSEAGAKREQERLKEQEAEEKQKALDENIRRLKAEIAARKKRRMLAEANGGGSGSATPSGAGTPVISEQKIKEQQEESKEGESESMSRNQSDANFDIVRGAVEETSKSEDSMAKATAKLQAETDVRHLQAQLADAEAEAEAMEVDTAMEEAPPSAADISNVEEQAHELMEVDASGVDAEVPNSLGKLDRHLLSTIVLTNRIQTEPNATLCRAEVGGGKCADRHCKDLHTNKGLPTDRDLIDYVLAVRGGGGGREEWARVAQAVLSAKMSIAKASTPAPAPATTKTGGKGKGKAEASVAREDPLERLLDKVDQMLSS
ncbi:hypothetical protein IAT38_002563 [Cryptococcus sp. DSM 104549]